MFNLPFIKNSGQASPKSYKFLSLDIGTDYIKCLLFEYDEDSKKFVVLGVGKQNVSYLATRGGSIVDYANVLESAKAALTEAVSQRKEKIKDVIIGLSGETTKGLVTVVRLTRPHHNTPISEKELSLIIDKIQDTAYVEAVKEVAEMTGDPDLEIELTNSSISSVKIDEQYVKDPLGMTGRKMEVALFTAFSPKHHLKLLQKLAKDLRLNILTISSSMYAVCKSLAIDPKYSNMIVIDIGGETTDVGVVFGDGLSATRTLSIGGRHVTRAISECFTLSIAEAEERKIRYCLGTLSEEESEAIQKCVSEVVELWLSGLEVLFSDFNGIKIYPSKIVLIGGGALFRGVEDLLARQQWGRTMQFKEIPVFEKATVSSLLRVNDLTGKAGKSDDVVPVSLAEVFLELKEK